MGVRLELLESSDVMPALAEGKGEEGVLWEGVGFGDSDWLESRAFRGGREGEVEGKWKSKYEKSYVGSEKGVERFGGRSGGVENK